MKARDYRAIGRAALQGSWGTSVGTTLVAVLLGASVTGSGALASFASAGGNTRGTDGSAGDFYYHYAEWMLPILAMMSTLAAVYLVVLLLFGGASTLGLRAYNMDLVTKRQPAQFGTLFSRYNYFGKALGQQLLVSLFSFLWTLLFMLPVIILMVLSMGGMGLFVGRHGILLGLGMLLPLYIFLTIGAWLAASVFLQRYAMASYILSQNPELGVMDSIRHSKDIMRGQQWRLFCLNFSFIGWGILAILSFGIGLLWLCPYMAAAEMAFYLNLTGQLPGQPYGGYGGGHPGPVPFAGQHPYGPAPQSGPPPFGGPQAYGGQPADPGAQAYYGGQPAYGTQPPYGASEGPPPASTQPDNGGPPLYGQPVYHNQPPAPPPPGQLYPPPYPGQPAGGGYAQPVDQAYPPPLAGQPAGEVAPPDAGQPFAPAGAAAQAENGQFPGAAAPTTPTAPPPVTVFAPAPKPGPMAEPEPTNPLPDTAPVAPAPASEAPTVVAGPADEGAAAPAENAPTDETPPAPEKEDRENND